MKYFNVDLTPTDGTFHRIGTDLLDTGRSTPESLYYVNLSSDGVMTAVIRFSGVPDPLEDRLSDKTVVYNHEVFGVHDEGFYTYLTGEPTGLAREFLRLTDQYNIVVETPMNITDHGGLEISVAGPMDNVQTALDEFPYQDVSARVKQVSEYDPGTSNMLPRLTRKQREILRTAVEKGYYEMPRETTQEEIAAEHDCSAPTVGEHLRKIENNVLTAFV